MIFNIIFYLLQQRGMVIDKLSIAIGSVYANKEKARQLFVQEVVQKKKHMFDNISLFIEIYFSVLLNSPFLRQVNWSLSLTHLCEECAQFKLI